MTGEYTEALIERKARLTEQLRRLDETLDTAVGDREEPAPLSSRVTEGLLHVRVGGKWYLWWEADVLTRSALAETDQGLADLGLLA